MAEVTNSKRKEKHFFIVPTDAHNYKIVGMLKQLKFRQRVIPTGYHTLAVPSG